MKSILIFFIIITTISIYSLEKMPGEYIESERINEIFKETDIRGSQKNGNYELYKLSGGNLSGSTIKFSIFDDPSKVLKWLEITIKTQQGIKVTTKILTDKGLLKGTPKRMMIKYENYYPFELDLSKNKIVQEETRKSLIKKDNKEILKKQKFIKNTVVRISGKTYKIKVYKVYDKKKNIDMEYALLDDKDTKVLGIAYVKQKNGTNLYLKEIGDNAVSIFPKKVPKLDFFNKISQFSESFMKQEEKRKKALEREKKLEGEEVDKDDPIKKLNEMIKKEGE